MSDTDGSIDDELTEGIMRKALAVELPSNFDPNYVPQSGEEYVRQVMYERTKIKKCVTANLDLTKFKNNQTFRLELGNNVPNAPGKFKPTQEWQNEKIKEFKDVRSFILSKIDSENAYDSLPKNIEELIFQRPPLYSEITNYSQSGKLQILQIIMGYIGKLKPDEKIDSSIGSWVYAVLLLLDIPLSPSICSTLRDFARICHRIRYQLSDDASLDVYMPLNLFICIIATFFNQLDLADFD